MIATKQRYLIGAAWSVREARLRLIVSDNYPVGDDPDEWVSKFAATDADEYDKSDVNTLEMYARRAYDSGG